MASGGLTLLIRASLEPNFAQIGTCKKRAACLARASVAVFEEGDSPPRHGERRGEGERHVSARSEPRRPRPRFACQLNVLTLREVSARRAGETGLGDERARWGRAPSIQCVTLKRLPQADGVAIRVGQPRKVPHARHLGGRNNGLAAETLGLVKIRLKVIDLNVEESHSCAVHGQAK